MSSMFYTRTFILEENVANYNPSNDENIIFNLQFNGISNSIIYDDSENQNHGNIYGATWIENIETIEGCTDLMADNYNQEANADDGTCQYTDYSLVFDGVDDYVEVEHNNSLNINLPMTVATRVFFEGDEDEIIAVNKRGDGNSGWMIGAWDNKAKFTLYGVLDYESEGDLVPGQYNDIAVVLREDNQLSFYINGELDSSFGFNNIRHTDNPLIIGCFVDGNGPIVEYLDQSIDELIILNTALNDSQISEYHTGINNFSDYQIAYWDFNNGEGEIVYDHSGNQNHGASYGGAAWLENIYDCTDELACNYNQLATVDDDSCEYIDLCNECGGSNTSCQIITDIDENEYGTVEIGNQTWMRQNLKVQNYNNNSPIPNWGAAQDQYVIYDNNPENSDIYGNLYTGNVASNENICPDGWHVPSYQDFDELLEYLGGVDVAGGKLKTTGTHYWNSPNIGATNETGFSAIPSGNINGSLNSFYELGENISLWTSSNAYDEESSEQEFAYMVRLFYDNDDALLSYSLQNNGFSIRCLMSTYLDGDVTLNGNVDVADIILILDYILNNTIINI